MAIPYLIINLIRGDREFPLMFAGYRMDIGRAEHAHVWPLEDVSDGETVRCISGFEDPEVIDRFRASGRDRIWVTPIIPFLMPIALSFAIIVFLGNPLFAFI